MDNTLIFDFETQSRCPLRTDGLARYANDPSTNVLCAAYILPGTTVPLLWLPGMPVPDFSQYVVFGWNVGFEKAIWETVLHWPAPKGWYDIAAHARFCGLPGSLENACEWLNLGDEGKDSEGKSLIDQLCIPIKTGKKKGQFRTKEEFPELFQKLYKYCQQDDVAEQTILNMLPAWPEYEQAIWQMTLAHNERGCPVDLDLCRSVVALTEQLLDRAKETLFAATNQAIVSPTQTKALLKWLNEQGVNVSNVDKTTVSKLLDDKTTPANIKTVLKARQVGAPAAIKKFKSALSKEVNGRLYHNFYYCGAGATGRWSGKSDDSDSVQLQNLFRANQTDDNLDIIKMADADILTAVCAEPMRELQKSVRSMLYAGPGNKFMYCDLAAIEARTQRWLARSPSLEVFRRYDAAKTPEEKHRLDPYVQTAAKAFNLPIEKITPELRTCGKVLALQGQYQSGGPKVKATIYVWSGGKTVVTDKFAADSVNAFRKSEPEIVKFWKDLERAFKLVLTGESESVRVGYLTFHTLGKSTVLMRLPSGRDIFYNKCSILEKDLKVSEEKVLRKGSIVYYKHDGVLVGYYGGHGSENAASGMARDIIAESMLKCESSGLPISHHVHDSVMIELPEQEAYSKVDLLARIMTTQPDWCKTLPLAAPVKVLDRMPA